MNGGEQINNDENDVNIVSLSKPYLLSHEVEYLLNLQSNISSLYTIKKKDAMSYLITMIKQLKLPLNILQDASYYFQRFFLFNPLDLYINTTTDVALTSLFVALKSRDFIKKLAVLMQISNKILMKPVSQNLQQQQKEFEIQRKRIMDLEKKFLEIGCFDFRDYSSEEWLIKFGKSFKLPKELIYMAWNILTDLYCSDLVLKFTANYNAISCLKLSYQIWNDINKNNNNNNDNNNMTIDITFDNDKINLNKDYINYSLSGLLEYYLENFQNSSLQDYLSNNKSIDDQYIKDFILNSKIEVDSLLPTTSIMGTGKSGISSNPLTNNRPVSINENDIFFKPRNYDITKLNSIRFMYNKDYFSEETRYATEFNKS